MNQKNYYNFKIILNKDWKIQCECAHFLCSVCDGVQLHGKPEMNYLNSLILCVVIHRFWHTECRMRNTFFFFFSRVRSAPVNGISSNIHLVLLLLLRRLALAYWSLITDTSIRIHLVRFTYCVPSYKLQVTAADKIIFFGGPFFPTLSPILRCNESTTIEL